MLKRFFISMLGTIAGIWVSIFILIIVAMIGIGVLIANSLGGESKLSSDKLILYLPLEGDIPERQNDIDFNSLINFDLETPETLSQMLEAIDKAADDKKVKGIFVEAKASMLGVASRTELIEALQKFKESGKWVLAYGNEYTQGDYYVATAADKLYLNPVGMIDVHGLSSTVIFYKDLMEKLGVKMQVVKVGSFKSAVEPYIRTDMSEPNKLQNQIFLNQIWGDMRQRIAQNRKVTAEEVNQWADSMSLTWDPDKYVAMGMATQLAYRSEVEDEMRTRLILKSDDELPLIKPSEYLSDTGIAPTGKGKTNIAVLYAVGDIVESGEMGGIISEKMVPEILQLAQDDEISGLILRVNSGGGSAFASEQIWKALEDFKAAGKPLYVSMSDLAASGGYYISCGADKIYADASTLTGSIGIFGMIPNLEGLLTDKLGLHFETVETNADANFPTMYKPMTPSQLAGMQSYVDRGYEVFVGRVAQGRNMPVDSVKKIAEGRVWDGISAQRIGLVDELGSLDQAIEDMADELGIASNRVVKYPLITNKWLELLSNSVEMKSQLNGISAEMLPYLRLLQQARHMHPLQARMDMIMIE